ncbi:hypothetical protein ACFXTH_030944 [Malus domestica]
MALFYVYYGLTQKGCRRCRGMRYGRCRDWRMRKDDGDAIADNYLLEESENESRPIEKGVVLADENVVGAVGNERHPWDLSASERRNAVESAHSVWRTFALCDCNFMDSDRGGKASVILRQLEDLKASKSEIERQISALEAQLREITLQKPNHNVSNRSCLPHIPSVDSGYGYDLSPQMIHRYSRHFLLPSFVV